MSRIFSAHSRVALFCRFEAELAHAQAELGVVPAAAAVAIGEACAIPIADPPALLEDGWEKGTPLIPLLEELRKLLAGDGGEWLHHGTTTQDVVDTALVLQMQAGLGVLAQELGEVAARLAELADAHRHTPMMGSTFLQAAVPTTFGAKAALWLSPLVGLRVELAERAAALPVQLGGPVGDMASFGESGPDLVAGLARRLGLVAPLAPWHTDRSPLTTVVAVVERVAAAAAKIASDLSLLAQSGIEEIRMRAGGSSSMPHKQNPVDALNALAAADVCHAVAGGVTAARPHERERAVGAWHAEWALVPMVFETAAACVAAVGRALAGLEVDTARMAELAGAARADTSHLIDLVLAAHRRAGA